MLNVPNERNNYIFMMWNIAPLYLNVCHMEGGEQLYFYDVEALVMKLKLYL